MNTLDPERLCEETTAVFVFRPLPISALVAAHAQHGTPFPISGDAITKAKEEK